MFLTIFIIAAIGVCLLNFGESRNSTIQYYSPQGQSTIDASQHAWAVTTQEGMAGDLALAQQRGMTSAEYNAELARQAEQARLEQVRAMYGTKTALEISGATINRGLAEQDPSSIEVGTVSPSGTGQVWSGTGWTKAENVPASSYTTDAAIQQRADTANTLFIGPTDVASIGVRDAQGNLTGEYRANAIFENEAGRANGAVPLVGGLAAYNKAEENSRLLSTGQYAKVNPSVVMSPLMKTDYSVQGRAGYSSSLGDSGTQALMQQGYSPSQSLLMQMEQAKSTTTLSDDRFFASEYQKSMQNVVEASSGYHSWAKDTGIPQAANPFEYSGDLALSLLKGTSGKSGAQATTPTDLTVLGMTGRGAQDISWDAARGGVAPDYSSLIGPTNVLSRAMSEGIMGDYGKLGSYSSGYGSLDLFTQQKVGYKAAKSAGWDTNLDILGDNPAHQSKELGFGLGFRSSTPAWDISEADKSLDGKQSIVSNSLPSPFRAPEGTIESSTGDIFGVNVPIFSNVLSFFQQGKSTRVSEKVTPLPEVTTSLGTTYTPIDGGMLATETFQTTGGKQINKTTSTTSTPSGFDIFQSDLSNRAYAGFGSLFGVTPEQAKLGVSLAMVGTREQANVAPTFSNIATSMGTADVQKGFDKPVQAGVEFGVGLAFGAGFKGLEAGVGAARATAAPAIIANGGTWRSADMFAGAVMNYAPKVLGGLYAADVGARSTSGFTDFKAGDVSSKVAPILTFETLPMGAGAALGYSAPSAAYKAAKVSNQGYLDALQLGKTGTPIKANIGDVNRLSQPVPKVEGSTTGRFDYYIKQPAKAGFESALSPATRLKLELPQFVEESGGSTARGVGAYAQYKAGNAYRANVDIPVKNFLQEAPGRLQAGQTSILEPLVRAKVEGVPKAQALLGRASIDAANWRYGETNPIRETIYGGYFDAKVNAPVRAEQGLVSTETSLWEFGQKAKNPVITAKAMWQERGFSMEIEPSGFPTFKGRGSSTPSIGAPPTTPPTKDSIPYQVSGRMGTKNVGGKSTSGLSKELSPSRISSRTIGGKSVSGLSREPSLKSDSIPAERIKTGFAKQRSVDFRGNPQSSTMKPMGKQAVGVSLLREPLPVVEGMTQGKMSPQQRTQSGISSSLSVGAVSVIQPEFEFAQTSRTRQEQSFVPQSLTRQFSAQVMGTSTRSSMEVLQRSKQDRVTSVFADIGRTSTQGLRNKQDSRREQDVLFGTDSRTIRTPIVSSRQSITTKPTFDTTSRTTSIITTRQTPWIETTLKKTPITPPPTILPFGFNFQPGSNQPAGWGGRGRGAHREVINIRSSLLSLFDRVSAPSKKSRRRK